MYLSGPLEGGSKGRVLGGGLVSRSSRGASRKLAAHAAFRTNRLNALIHSLKIAPDEETLGAGLLVGLGDG